MVNAKIETAFGYVLANLAFYGVYFYLQGYLGFYDIDARLVMSFYSAISFFAFYLIYLEGERMKLLEGLREQDSEKKPARIPYQNPPTHPYIRAYEDVLRKNNMTPATESVDETFVPPPTPPQEEEEENLVEVRFEGKGFVPQGRIQGMKIDKIIMKKKEVEKAAMKEEEFVGAGYGAPGE